MSLSEYVSSRMHTLTLAFGQHAVIVIVSILIATVIGVGVGLRSTATRAA